MELTNMRPERGDVYSAMCPCRDVLDLLANKWTALAIGTLEDGPQRFGELRRRLEGVSPKVLSQTLRRLTEHGLIDRTVFPVVPSHVEYALTELGRGAVAPLAHLRGWIEQNIDAFWPEEEAAEGEAGGGSAGPGPVGGAPRAAARSCAHVGAPERTGAGAGAGADVPERAGARALAGAPERTGARALARR
jgi:DNA-binding HxlR family transcriptional regulator